MCLVVVFNVSLIVWSVHTADINKVNVYKRTSDVLLVKTSNISKNLTLFNNMFLIQQLPVILVCTGMLMTNILATDMLDKLFGL